MEYYINKCFLYLVLNHVTNHDFVFYYSNFTSQANYVLQTIESRIKLEYNFNKFSILNLLTGFLNYIPIASLSLTFPWFWCCVFNVDLSPWLT